MKVFSTWVLVREEVRISCSKEKTKSRITRYIVDVEDQGVENKLVYLEYGQRKEELYTVA